MILSLFYIPKVISKLHLDGKLQVTVVYYPYYKRDFSHWQTLWLVKCYFENIYLLWSNHFLFVCLFVCLFFQQLVIGWLLNIISCCYTKFMIVNLCLFWADKQCTCGSTTLVQAHTDLVNSKVFLKCNVNWNCLLVYSLSLTHTRTNLQKAAGPLFCETVYLTNIIMSL